MAHFVQPAGQSLFDRRENVLNKMKNQFILGKNPAKHLPGNTHFNVTKALHI